MKVDNKSLKITQIKRNLKSLFSSIDPLVETKFSNINGKTAKVYVEDHLFQQRTPRTNRILIPWKSVNKNKLSIDELNTFSNGVCVEFVNYDFFNDDYLNNETFNELKTKLGSDDNVSSIISFKTEDGDPGANTARESFDKFKTQFPDFTFKPIVRKQQKFSRSHLGKGNEKWEGNSYYVIKGGQQLEINSHKELSTERERKPQLFNPAIEYANQEVCDDILITLSYFFLHCHDIETYIEKIDLKNLKHECESYLKNRDYDEGNLLEYCIKHPTLSFENGTLIDPIQVEKINVLDFKGWDENDPLSIALCHNEAVNKNIIKFDTTNNYIVTAARPTNLFWSRQYSNMLQQSYTLNEFFELEAERVSRRKKFLS